MNKYDLITQINTRGHFHLVQLALPHMEKNGYGRVISMGPPIKTHYKAFGGFTAYNISKYGMTMVAMGAAAEYEGKGITGHSLWPATVIESQASINFELGDRDMWRKADILADAVLGLVSAPDAFTGRQLIDDEYLQQELGLSAEDLAVYRWDPEVEPARLLDPKNRKAIPSESTFTRGDVRKLDQDKHQDAQQSKL